MSKKGLLLSALSLAMMSQGNPMPDMRVPKKSEPWKLKKCKSCKSYTKYGYGKCTRPMNQACENYQHKKKR